MTDAKRKNLIAALIRERAAYVQQGRTDRVAEVDSALRDLGASAEPPVKRATRRKKKEA